MNVLVVGASGFIGRNLLLGLPKDWKVFGTYNTSGDFVKFLEGNRLTNVTPIKCDLTNAEETRKAIGGLEGIDVCVYLSANTNVRAMVENPIIDLNTNIATMLNFLQSFRGKKLIFFSSGAVYMGHSGRIDPSAKLEPTIPYAISKYACEQYIKFYHSARKTFDKYVIIRFFGAYGPYEPERKISTKLVETIRDNGSEFTVFGDGGNYIDFMHIDDAIDGVKAIINSDRANLTVDLCSGNAMSINDLVNRVAGIFGKKLEIKHNGSSPEYIAFYASTDGMQKLFGFRPKVTMEDGFRRFADWLAARK